MRTMLDSTDPSAIRAALAAGVHADLIAGYVNDQRVTSRWIDADLDPASWTMRLVKIAIYTDRLDANVIDSEPQNNDAAQGWPWVRDMWDAGKVPTVYCFPNDAGPEGFRLQDWNAACDANGVPRPCYWLTRPTTFTDAAARLAGNTDRIVAVQWRTGSVDGYDISVVLDHWPGVDPPAPPIPASDLWDQTIPDDRPATYGTLRRYAEGLRAAMIKAGLPPL